MHYSGQGQSVMTDSKEYEGIPTLRFAAEQPPHGLRRRDLPLPEAITAAREPREGREFGKELDERGEV